MFIHDTRIIGTAK